MTKKVSNPSKTTKKKEKEKVAVKSTTKRKKLNNNNDSCEDAKKAKGKKLIFSNSIAAVIFINNEYVQFENLEAAEKASLYMKESQIKCIKTFNTEEELKEFVKKEKEITSIDDDDKKLPATPSSTIMGNKNTTQNVTPSPIALKNPVESVSPAAVQTSIMTQLLERTANSKNNQLVIHTFQYKKPTSSSFKPSCQPIAVDFVEFRTGVPIWNHKPNLWEMLFSVDKISPKEQMGQYIDSFFHEFKACAQRDNPLSNEIKQRTTKNQKIVQYWLLYRLVPIEMSDEDIKNNIMQFAKLAEDAEIQNRYHTLISNQGFVGDLVKQTEPTNGNYWKKLQNASKYNVKMIKQNNLSSLFKDEEIKIIVEQMFQISMPSHLWPQEIKNFAFQCS